jgi:hypothetical protein
MKLWGEVSWMEEPFKDRVWQGTRLSIAISVVDMDFGAGDFLLRVVDGILQQFLALKS